MAHQIGLGRSLGRLRAVATFVVALSFLFVTAAEGSHAHDDADGYLPLCSVCELAHDSAAEIASGTSHITESNLLSTSVLPSQEPALRRSHLSSRRSRAPPLPISL